MVGSTSILKSTYHDHLDEVFQRQMYESALRDGLTKVFNKKYFTDYLEKEFAFAVRHGGPLALIFLDIDHFKKINDSHGHPAGDFVLAELSQMMTELLRTEDVLARFGGEEFTILCRGSDLQGALIVAERLRASVQQRSSRSAARTSPSRSAWACGGPRKRRQRPRGVPGCRRQGALRGQAHGPQPRLRARLGVDAQPDKRNTGPQRTTLIRSSRPSALFGVFSAKRRSVVRSGEVALREVVRRDVRAAESQASRASACILLRA